MFGNILLVIMVFTLFACSDGSDVSNTGSIDTDEITQKTKKPSRTRRATVIEATASLGDDEYQFDKVFCVGGFIQRIALTDTRNVLANDFPQIVMTVYKKSDSSGVFRGTVSFDFRNADGGRVLWKLDSGEVIKDGKKFSAQGVLRGSRMVTQDDGSDKPMPLTGESLKPFQVQGEC